MRNPLFFLAAAAMMGLMALFNSSCSFRVTDGHGGDGGRPRGPMPYMGGGPMMMPDGSGAYGDEFAEGYEATPVMYGSRGNQSAYQGRGTGRYQGGTARRILRTSPIRNEGMFLRKMNRDGTVREVVGIVGNNDPRLKDAQIHSKEEGIYVHNDMARDGELPAHISDSDWEQVKSERQRLGLTRKVGSGDSTVRTNIPGSATDVAPGGGNSNIIRTPDGY